MGQWVFVSLKNGILNFCCSQKWDGQLIFCHSLSEMGQRIFLLPAVINWTDGAFFVTLGSDVHSRHCFIIKTPSEVQDYQSAYYSCTDTLLASCNLVLKSSQKSGLLQSDWHSLIHIFRPFQCTSLNQESHHIPQKKRGKKDNPQTCDFCLQLAV